MLWSEVGGGNGWNLEVSKDYEIGGEREYEINKQLKKTMKEDLDCLTGQWTYYDQKMMIFCGNYRAVQWHVMC